VGTHRVQRHRPRRLPPPRLSMDELDELNAGCLDGHGFVWVDETHTPRPLSQVRAEAEEIRERLVGSLRSGERVVVRPSETAS